MGKLHVCNYAILKFLPYPETEEFANIGVVLCCPEISFFDYKIESLRLERISGFFPDLKIDVYSNGINELIAELKRVKLASVHVEKLDITNLFAEITKPRENVFCFSDIRTKLCLEPENEVGVLFSYYVSHMLVNCDQNNESLTLVNNNS